MCVCTRSTTTCVQHPLFTNSRQETVLKHFLEILKRTIQNFEEMLKKCFFGITSDVRRRMAYMLYRTIRVQRVKYMLMILDYK